jgi:PAS domain S-box-containing protein
MAAKIKDRKMLEKLSQAITEIMRNLGTTSLEKRLTTIAEFATKLLNAEVSAIFLVKRKGFLTLEASYGHRRGKFQKGEEFAIRSGRKTGLTGHIAAKGKLFNAYGKALTTHYAVRGTKSTHIPSGNCCSLLAIPLKKKSERGEKLIGLLRVENKMSADRHPFPDLGFTKEDEWILQIFAEAIVIAIENVGLVEQQLTQQDRLKRLVANSPVGIVAVDNKGYVIQFNEKAEQILGYAAKEAIKRIHVSKLYYDPKVIQLISERLDSSRDGMISRFRTDLKSKQGEIIPISLAVTRLYDSKKERVGSVGYFEDLRLIQEKERQLELLLRASDTISQAKTVTTGLNRLARMMVSLITSTFCRILLIDETKQYLIPRAAYPVPRASASLNWQPGLDQSLTISAWPELSRWLDEGKPQLITIHKKGYQTRLAKISRHMRLEKTIQSLLIVPLKVEKKTVGILEVGELRSEKRTSFSSERINLVGAIAAQTAVLIDRIRLHEDTELHNHLLRSSFIASTELISPRNPYEVIQHIVDRMRIDTKASWVSLVFIDEQGKVSRSFPSGAVGQPDIATVIRPDGNSMLVMRTGEALSIKNVKEPPAQARETRHGFNPIMLKESNVAAALCLPVSLQRVRIGVMWIHYDRPRHFSQSEINAWQLYVNHAAKAYDNARRMDELKRMRDATEALAKAASVEAVLDQIVYSACKVLQAKAAALWWYDSIRDMFVAGKSVACGIPDHIWGKFKNRGPHPKGTAYTVLQKKLIEVRDTHSTQAYSFMGEGTRELLEKIGVRRFLGIALALGKEKFGVLYVDYELPRKFSKEERETVRAFANHATLALKKAKLLEDVEKARNIARIVAKVTTLGELGGTLELIVGETMEALNCDAVTLYEYDHVKQEISPQPVMDGVRNKEGTRQYPGVKPDSIVAKILRRRQMLVVNNVHGNALFKDSRFTRDENIESCLAIPLRVGKEKVKVGVMFVNYCKPHRFTLHERTNIELFANQAAVAISNAQLYEREQKRTESLEALYKAGRAITGSLDEGKILKSIARQAWQIAKSRGKLANFSDIRMVYGSKVRLEAVYPNKILSQTHWQLGTEIDLSHGVDGNIGIIGRAVIKGEPQLIPDVSKVPYYRKFHDHTHSELVVPIIIDDDVIGTINVEHPAYNAFDEKDQQTFESLAAQASIAIQNARRYAHLKKTITSLEAKTSLAWMGMASATWRHKIENYAENITRFAIEIHEEMSKVTSPDGIRKQLGGIHRMVKKIQKKSPTTVPLSAPRSIQLIRICELIDKHIEELKTRDLYESVDVRADYKLAKSTTVRASAFWLKQALELLCDNAAEAMRTAKQKRLLIRVEQHDGRVEIRIADTGKGIPKDVETQLFRGPVKKPRAARGLGFGLLQVQAIIEAHGGDIKLEPTSSRIGTTMLVWLPLAPEPATGVSFY